MGEVIHIGEWLNRPDKQAIRLRLADIAVEKALLEGEEQRLLEQLNGKKTPPEAPKPA